MLVSLLTLICITRLQWVNYALCSHPCCGEVVAMKFAHGTTAVLLWHIQKFVEIWYPGLKPIFHRIWIPMKISFVKWAQGKGCSEGHVQCFYFRLLSTVWENRTIHIRMYPHWPLGDAPDNKVHGTNMGPTWILSVPDGPHVGPMNLAIRGGCNPKLIIFELISRIAIFSICYEIQMSVTWPRIGSSNGFVVMITSQNGNLFRIIDPLRGVPPVINGFPSLRVNRTDLWYFLRWKPEQTVEQTV